MTEATYTWSVATHACKSRCVHMAALQACCSTPVYPRRYKKQHVLGFYTVATSLENADKGSFRVIQ